MHRLAGPVVLLKEAEHDPGLFPLLLGHRPRAGREELRTPSITYAPNQYTEACCGRRMDRRRPVIRFGWPWPKFRLSTRMTLVRLASRELFLHSPTQLIGTLLRSVHRRPELYPLMVDPRVEGRFSRRRRLPRATHWGAPEGPHPIRRPAARSRRRLFLGHRDGHASDTRQLHDGGGVLPSCEPHARSHRTCWRILNPGKSIACCCCCSSRSAASHRRTAACRVICG